MKASIEFELPENQREYELCVNAERFYEALLALESALRQEMKYKIEQTGEHYMEMFYDILNDKGVRLD